MCLDWHYYRETSFSTQDLAKSWLSANRQPVSAKEDAESGLDSGLISQRTMEMDRVGVFYTFSQQKGRGQAGNEWFCGRGDNIAMTLVFQPRELEAMYLFCLDMALSMGILRYARRINADCCLKWPNDLYSGNRKLAGILMETRIAGTQVEEVYLGIGLNMNQEVFPENLPNPVSFRQLDGMVRDLQEESRQLAVDISNAYDSFMKRLAGNRGKEESVFERYKKEYLDSLLFRGQWRDFFFRGEIVHARIEDVDECGHLWLRDRQGRMFSSDIKELRYCLPG